MEFQRSVLGVSQWPRASPRGLLILLESTLGKFKFCLLLNVYDNCLPYFVQLFL